MGMFNKVVERATKTLTGLSMFCLVGIVAVEMTNIILRFFGSSLLGSIEIIQFLMAVAVAFSLGYCAIQGGHVFVSLLILHLSKKIRILLSIITGLLGIGIWALIAWQGAVFAKKQWKMNEITEILEWPIYPMRYIFVLGVIVLCLALIVDLVNEIKGVSEE